MSDDNDTKVEGDKTAEDELELEASKIVEKLHEQLAPLRKTLEQFQKLVDRLQIDPKVMKGLSSVGSALRNITEQAERDYAPQLRSFAGLADRGERIAELGDRISELEEELARLRHKEQG